MKERYSRWTACLQARSRPGCVFRCAAVVARPRRDSPLHR